MILKRDYDQIIRENFDLSDKYTRQYIVTLEDAQQEQLIDALSAALYDKIVAKVDEIDFGTIPKSRGDITKVQGFENNKKCIDIIRQLVVQYHQNPAPVDIISAAIQNIADRKPQFTKAYGMNAEFPMVIYNLIVLSIFRSVSYLIASCIDYIKDTSNNSFSMDVAAYKQSAENVMFKQLSGFNDLCANGTMDAILANTLTPIKEAGDIFGADDDGAGYVASMDDDNESPFDSNNGCEPFKCDNEPGVDPIRAMPSDVPDVKPAGYEDYTQSHPVILPNPDDLDLDDVDDDGDDVPDFDDDVLAMFDDDDLNDNVEPDNIPQVTDDGDDDLPTEPVNEFSAKNAGAAIGGFIDKNASKLGKLIGDLNSDKYKGSNGKFKLSKYVGTFDKAKKTVLAIGGGLTLGWVFIKIILPTAKNLIYNLVYSSMKFSDYLEIQAQLLEAHADDVEHSSDMNEDQRTKVANKQRKWAARLKKWSNIFSMDVKQAQNKADAESKKDDASKKRVAKDDDGDDVLF